MLDFFRKYKVFVSKVLLTALALGFGPGLFAAVDEGQSADGLGIFERISKYYMPSLVGLEKAEVQKENKAMRSNAIPMKVGSVEALSLTYGILSAPYLKDIFGEFKKRQLLDECVFSDLEIYCGREGSGNSLFSKIDFTRTPFGKARLQSLFMQKFDNLSESISGVVDLQRKVKALVENEELFNKLDAKLAELKDVFGDLLWMWKLNDTGMNFIDQAYFPKLDIPLVDKNYEIDLRKYNNNSFMLSSYFAFFTWGSLIVMTAYYIYSEKRKTESEKDLARLNADVEHFLFDHARNPDQFNNSLVSRIREMYHNLPLKNLEKNCGLNVKDSDMKASVVSREVKFDAQVGSINARTGLPFAAFHGLMWMKEEVSYFLADHYGYLLIAAFLVALHIYSSYRSNKYFKDVFKAVHEKMKRVSLFYGNMASFEESLKGIDVFAELLNVNEKNKRRLVSEKEYVTFKTLFNELVTSSEYKNPSFFMGKGKILADFKKFLSLKSSLVSSLLLVGEIDMLVSIAKLYKTQAQHPHTKYCFSEFVTADQPYINIKDFWCPLLNPDDAKTNNLELGTPQDGRGVILTGPNAAGKSSSLKGIIISIILSQTLGIAPASSIKLTPFSKISSHLNVSDKQGSESLFQAEMNRALRFLADVKKLGKGEFMFTILDELFSSTNPEEGMSGAYGIVKSLADYPGCMSILATHYKKLTELESKTNGFFKNYKVYVEMKDGVIFPPYKFVPGISDQSMALLLMHKQGFDKQVLSEAFNVLAQIKDDKRSIIMPEGF